MAANTPVRQRTGTVDTSKAVDHRESAFLAPGRHDRSTIRLKVYFFLATRASRIAGRWATNDRLKRLPPGLVRLPFPLWTTRQAPRVPSDPHRSSTIDVLPQNQPRSAKEALELAPTATAWRAGPPRSPAGVRSRSRVRCTSLTHAAQTISFFHRLATNNTDMERIGRRSCQYPQPDRTRARNGAPAVSTRSYGTQPRPGTEYSAPVPFPWARCGFRSPTRVLLPPII